MSRSFSARWPIWVWECNSCGLVNRPPIDPAGRLRFPHPFEMREAGWYIGETDVLDLCPVCATMRVVIQ